MIECPTCEGSGLAEDETACGDPDHCSPWIDCPECQGSGEMPEPTEGDK